METLGYSYQSHRAFYDEDSDRQLGSERSLEHLGDWGGLHLGYIVATEELYLGSPRGGAVELLARLAPAELAALLSESSEARTRDLPWLRGRLKSLRTPGLRSRPSSLAG